MEADTLKRFDRLVAILIQLQSKKIIKSQELAERFEVSLRTIYRDIKTLEKAGVPLYGEAGVGYSLVNGYRLPPVMFTREEASSFLAAGKLMQEFTDESLGKYFESALFKIKSVLRTQQKDWLNILDTKVSIHPTRPLFNKAISNAMETFMESLVEQKQILLTYRAFYADEPTLRFIEPVGLFHEYENWYIWGYCHLRKDYRQFRLDRILQLEKADKSFTREHPTVETYRKKKQEQKRRVEVELLIEKSIMRYVEPELHYFKDVHREVKGKQILLTFKIAELDEGFARWLLMFGDYLEIKKPASLKKRVKEIVLSALKKLEEE